MRLQANLFRWALRLQTRPFTWIFRAYYGLAIQSSRWLVGRVPGVRSIYLSGSLAGEDVIYGLSDIDFKIFVSGDRTPAVYRSIRRRFRLLRRLFPMLGSPDEKGIYFLDSFASEYAHYPLVRHLFDERFFRHRRIFGEDVIRALPVRPWQELDQGECAHGRLKDWIERIHILADGDALGGQQKQHLFFKAVCDVALLAIRIRRPDFAFRRRADILRRILPELNEADRGLAENLIAENGSRYRWKRNGDGDNYRLFKSMVALCGERAACGGEVEASFPQIESCVADHPDADPVVARTLAGFSGKIRHVSQFLTDVLELNAPAFGLNPELRGRKLTWHDPCHLNRHLGVKEQPRRILKSLDGAEYVEMPNADRCCGMAGQFSMMHYELSQKIAEKKMDAVASSGADVVVTACPGCQFQLSEGVARRKMPQKVMSLMDVLR